MNPFKKGIIAEQAHVGIPDGLHEEEYARNGFFGKYAHLYRTEPPVGWSKIEGPLKPHSMDLREVKVASDDFIENRKVYLFNDDVRVLFTNLKKPMEYFYRNADADEAFFVHEGQGIVETDFGPLDYEKGDYVIIPRGTVYRWEPTAATQFLLVESFSEFELPDKGILGQHALFDPAVMKIPNPITPEELKKKNSEGKEWEVKVKQCDQYTSIHYPFYPLNAVGWKGTLSSWKINVRDIRPISSDRYHLPPTAHITFVANNFVICTFLPRPLENGDPKAVKVPFYHSNIDFDEVLFYHDGEFFSRTDIAPGMLTFHPQGIQHGPQKGAIERSAKATSTQEVAVMIDTKRPLFMSEDAKKIENDDYWKSWR